IRQRGRTVSIAGAIALVGVFSFVVAAWQLGGQPRGEEAPADAALAAPMPEAQTPPPAEPVPVPTAVPSAPPPEPARTASAPEAAPVEEDVPEVKAPPKSQRAYVTITTNVPARVYIDGAKVGRSTPLTRFPIKAGRRHIRLVSLTTGEPQEMDMRFNRGQHHKLVVNSFRSAPRR
ncbi:PEGA domain-containing protein, partial [Pyxidicoccus fallax]|uniref:PEGA domain-containing protein n=1 Tax=Pyxidicoccus fallax TaxID=394095 RepID=UPI001494D57B